MTSKRRNPRLSIIWKRNSPSFLTISKKILFVVTLVVLVSKLFLYLDQNSEPRSYEDEFIKSFGGKPGNETMPEIIRKAEIPPPFAPWQNPASNQESQVASLTARIRQELIMPAFKKAEREQFMLYVVNNGTLLALQEQEQFTRKNGDWYRGRWKPFEEMVQAGLDVARLLLSDESTFTDFYSSTHSSSLLLSDLIDGHVSLPLIFDAKDWESCARFNGSQVLEKTDFPYFTYAMSTFPKGNCTPFAIPCYEMWRRLKETAKFVPSDWDRPQRSDTTHPSWDSVWDTYMPRSFHPFRWDNKIRKLVWRGSSTGKLPPNSKDWRELPRFKLVKVGMENRDTMDFAITKLVQEWQEPDHAKEIKKELGNRLSSWMDFTHFMKYRGIVDIEGNSWSSRLGHLFCLNSVVIRIDRSRINYFEKELQPWVHYIPVKEDLSDLEDVAKYVADDMNDEQLKAMVQAGNDWCRIKMTQTQFAIDMLYILLSYIDFLFDVDPNWIHQWSNITQSGNWVPVVDPTIFASGLDPALDESRIRFL